MKLTYAAAMIAVVLASSAWAQTAVTTSTTSCKDTYAGHVCTTISSTGEPESPRQLSQKEERKYREDKAASIRKWEAYCRPTRHIEEFGVTRLHYAHEGCEFGRSETDEEVAAADADRYGSTTTSVSSMKD
jgi:hypothetical protein